MIFFPLQNCAVQKEIHWTFNKPCFVLFFQRPSTLLQIQRRKPCFKIHPRQMCTPNYKSWPLKILPVSLVTIFNAWLIPFLEVENSREASVLLVLSTSIFLLRSFPTLRSQLCNQKNDKYFLMRFEFSWDGPSLILFFLYQKWYDFIGLVKDGPISISRALLVPKILI